MKVSALVLYLLLQNSITNGKEGISIISKDINIKDDDFSILILEILLNTLVPYKCVAMITDGIYYDVFKDTLFKKFEIYLSFFMIYVQESEDLLSPYSTTQECLLKIKYHDCQTYVILISNGQQASRLLSFGDRYRLLDTRAKFIMLYDRRLFYKPSHYLWKRIVNVIFIREYVGIKKMGDITVTIPWFTISTVPFPSPIQDTFVLRRLDIWRKSKFRTGTNLFQDKTRNLRNQTMRVVAIKHTPATMKIPYPEDPIVRAIMGDGSKIFTGLEVEILAAVSKAMNFKCELYEASNADVEFWGKQLSDGQYTGLIGEMVGSRADIALGDLYYISYVLELMDLTVPYNTECLTFLTPESLSDNSWKTLILPFKLVMWLCVILCLFLCGIIFHYLALFQCKINELNKKKKDKFIKFFPKKKQTIMLPLLSINQQNPHSKYVLMKEQFAKRKEEGAPIGLYLFSDFFNSILYTYGMLFMASLPKLPTGWSLRMLTGWYWLYCILVAVSYRASMTAILANPAPRVTINTLQELMESKLSCGGWGDVNRELFKTSLDSASQMIGANFEIINDSQLAVERVSEGKFALYENIYFLKEASVTRQMHIQSLVSTGENRTVEEKPKKSERNLHIMKDCVINMPISIGLQKNSPIKPTVDKYIRRVLEAGLIKKWLDDVMQPTLNAETPRTLETTKAFMSMQKFIGAIVALFTGYFISFISFFVEIIYFHFFVRKHSRFNKYSRRIYH